uniref:Uncharacterized protein n=1 Tax=Globisporangium ultimum (strain ATCC 200006 / CBS 805.95 / DAOM BR144) TaxID=431595 RepID=K3WR53_GLOUD
MLLDNGANADIILPLGSEFMTLLHHASIYAPEEAVELLLECGANVNQTTTDGRSALHLVAAESCQYCAFIVEGWCCR